MADNRPVEYIYTNDPTDVFHKPDPTSPTRKKYIFIGENTSQEAEIPDIPEMPSQYNKDKKESAWLELKKMISGGAIMSPAEAAFLSGDEQ